MKSPTSKLFLKKLERRFEATIILRLNGIKGMHVEIIITLCFPKHATEH